MHQSISEQHIEYSETHWWFRGRYKIVALFLEKYINKDGTNKKILDLGSGAGAMIPLLTGYGNVTAVEPDSAMSLFLRETYGEKISVIQGSLDQVDSLNYFDLICLFDVLEHIEDDMVVLKSCREKLVTGGSIVLTVPAYQFLWSYHDDLNHHKRRYVKKDLTRKLVDSGFTITHTTYFNFLLFPAIFAIRCWHKLRGTNGKDFEQGEGVLNNVLTLIFKSEIGILRFIPFPFGVSIFCIATKK